MSIRRKPGEIVKRRPGSGFVASEDPSFIQVPNEPEYSNCDPCMMGCGDPACREWANWEIIGQPGEFIYHIAECEVESC